MHINSRQVNRNPSRPEHLTEIAMACMLAIGMAVLYIFVNEDSV